MHAVVVAHGLWMPGTESALLRRRLAAAGFEPYLFRFRTVGLGLDDNADRLAQFMADVPGDRVHVVGHSLGGVVAVNLFQRGVPARGGSIVCLGSPLNGSRAARALARWPGGQRALGLGIRELDRRGGLDPWRVDRPLGIIAGDAGLGMGRAICRLPAPNDGTVCVDETRLEGATDHIVLPVTHFSMLVSRPVIDAAVRFLREGRLRT